MFKAGRNWLGIVCTLFVSWPGCRAPDKLVHDQFVRIRPHHSNQAEVVDLIGEPDSRLQNHWVYQRPDRHLVVFVEFDEKGQVSRTQWVDAGQEVWEDTRQPKSKP